MATALLPHAQILPTTANYDLLDEDVAAQYDHYMGQADTTSSNDHYRSAMVAAAYFAGIQLPPDGEILKCACRTCYCALIFPANAPGTRTVDQSYGYNLGRIQCPGCADEHPADHDN